MQTEFAHTLAVYCSDGRFAPATDEFVRNALHEECYDRFVVPGGPAWLCLDIPTVWEHEMARRHISFLVEAHQIRRVILVAHQQCGFYERHYRSPEQKQMADLRTASRILLERHPGIAVEAYYLRIVEGKLVFVAVGPPEPCETSPPSNQQT
ncbi:MAG: carbonic anhydrase [Armatimonadota bacterium]